LDRDRIRDLLQSVAEGSVSIDEALDSLSHLPYEDLGFAKIDHHRALRQGFPEVVFCQGKTPEQVLAAVKSIHSRAGMVLATRADAAAWDAVRKAIPEANYDETARIIWLGQRPPDPAPDAPYIAVVSAGTADLAVAEEAAVTAELLGSTVQRAYDVGVAGLHRLLDRREMLAAAKAIIVVAGMEGALASVVGGLVSAPVIAVPTSVGYGASFHGLAALLTMLNSCATGVAVVNIDNGFGAGFFAHLISR
jgi:NCAIR mutase (PurE)-related protein